MSCLHPNVVYNKYLGEYVSVPCGKCEACCISRQMDYANRVRIECEKHPHNLFFTLTYDNDHIPFICSFDNYIHSLDGRFDKHLLEDGFSHDIVFDDKPFDNIVNCDVFQSDGLAVLFYYDLQIFFKRVRSHLYYYYRKLGYEVKEASSLAKIRYAVCGEYGPYTHRPHYHGILHFDSYEASEFVRTLIPKVWTLCDWDSLVKSWINRGKPVKSNPLPTYCSAGSASNYVSKYVSNFVGSNVLDSLSQFRPFFKTSRKPLYGVSEFDTEVYKKSFTEKPLVFKQISVAGKNGIHTAHVLLSKRFLCSVFPKFSGFSIKDVYATYTQLVFWRSEHLKNKYTRYVNLVKSIFGEFNFYTFCDYVYSMLKLDISFRSFILRSRMLLFDARDVLGYLVDNFDGFVDKSESYIKSCLSNFVSTCNLNYNVDDLYNCLIFTSYDYHSFKFNLSVGNFISDHYKVLYGKKVNSHVQFNLCTV